MHFQAIRLILSDWVTYVFASRTYETRGGWPCTRERIFLHKHFNQIVSVRFIIMTEKNNRTKESTPDLGSPQQQGGENSPVSVSMKRPRGSPTFHTPHRVRKRIPLRQKTPEETMVELHVLRLSQPLEQPNSKLQEKWSDQELQALIEFVLFLSDGDSWPAHKQDTFWNSASEYVHTRGGSNVVRMGK